MIYYRVTVGSVEHPMTDAHYIQWIELVTPTGVLRHNLTPQDKIENAVKHNEISNRKPLTIHITTDDNGNLSISNDIQPKWTATSGTGIGLANLAKRYRLLFKRDIQITEDKEFTVCIPLIEKSQLEQ